MVKSNELCFQEDLSEKNRVLILDEVLSAVDKETANEIRDDLVSQLELTLLMISHHLEWVKKCRVF